MIYACVLQGSWVGPAQSPLEARVPSTQSSRLERPARLALPTSPLSSFSVRPNRPGVEDFSHLPTLCPHQATLDTLFTPLPLLA